MQKTISVCIVICILFTAVFFTSQPLSVFGADNGIDFESAEPIDSDIVYQVSVDSGDYEITSFTASEDGYYLFEALGDKYRVGAFFGNEYNYYEPVATLFDSQKNEVQYVEFDAYDPSVDNNAPYAKMVQKIQKGETYFFKTNLLDPKKSGTYLIRVMKAPDLVFTYSSEDEYSGCYQVYRYTGSEKEFTIKTRYTVRESESLYTPDNNVILRGISLGAFEGNEFLETINLPYDFDFIASEAFFNCKKLSNVNLSRNIDTIGYRAFAGCDSLKSITIRSFDVILEPQCFGYDESGNKYSDFTIICNEGSTAEEYAKANGINYSIISSIDPVPTESSHNKDNTDNTNNTGTDNSDNTNSTGNTDNSNDSNSTEPSNSNTSDFPEPTSATPRNTIASISGITASQVIKDIKPKVKKAKIKKVTKTSKKRRLKVSWKKIRGVSGYQIKCGLNRKMKKGKKVVFVNANRSFKIIKGLKSKRVYYIKVRAYKKYVSAKGEIKKSFGKWSKIIKAKTR